jgi:prepilin-type N-terminal cleavage/methylation domain-containing protein
MPGRSRAAVRRASPARTRAFSLVEVIVVMAIISLLVSILMPSMGRAREQARQIVCRNNLRSIWTGVLEYAYSHNDRVPYMEDVNMADPNADPFDPQYAEAVGVVLMPYVNPGSWRCPSAIKGFPENAGEDGWKMTYWFRTAGPPGNGKAFYAGNGGAMDPVVSNYAVFDGRPLKYVSGRRHTPSNPQAPNRDAIGPWTFSFPIIADLVLGSEAQGTPRYPHRGVVDQRSDLLAARETFEQNTRTGFLPARMELHVHDDRQVQIFLTRSPYPHRQGF